MVWFGEFLLPKNKKTKTPKDLKKAFGLGLAVPMCFMLAGRKASWEGFIRDSSGTITDPVSNSRKKKMGVVSCDLSKTESRLVSWLVLRMQELSDFMASVKESLAGHS